MSKAKKGDEAAKTQHAMTIIANDERNMRLEHSIQMHETVNHYLSAPFPAMCLDKLLSVSPSQSSCVQTCSCRAPCLCHITGGKKETPPNGKEKDPPK